MKEDSYLDRRLRQLQVTKPTKQELPELDVYYDALKAYYQTVDFILAEVRTRRL